MDTPTRASVKKIMSHLIMRARLKGDKSDLIDFCAENGFISQPDATLLRQLYKL